MVLVVNHVKMEDEDPLDIQFWKAKSSTERLAEVTRLRINYYTWLNGFYPEKYPKWLPQEHYDL